MTQDICLAGKVENIAALLTEYRVPTAIPVLMLLEMQPTHLIEPLEPQQQQDLLRFANFERSFEFARYTSGRIFHQDGELRWEKQADAFQVVYTGHIQYSPELKDTTNLALDNCLVPTKCYYLFGKRLDTDQLQRIGAPTQAGDFAEVRIPRLLRYPAPSGSKRVQLVVKEYNDPATGVNIAFRFTGLVGAE